MRIATWTLGLAAAAALSACGAPPPSTPGRFGEITSAVVIVNPIINAGSSTSVAVGDRRGGVSIRAADLPSAQTDSTGLALIEGLPTGSIPLTLDSGTATLQVSAEKELYDVLLAYRPDGVQHVVTPVRYPIGGSVVVVEPGSDLSAAAVDDAIIMLKPGTYPGHLELRAEGVLIFGAWSAEEGPLSKIDGDVTVLGGGNRIRGVEITGKLTSSANGFSSAFCTLGSAHITGNSVTLIRNRFVASGATVPSSNSVLVDNEGIP